MDNSKATEAMDAPVDASEDAIPGASETQTRKEVNVGQQKHVDGMVEVVVPRGSSFKHTLSEANAQINREVRRRVEQMQINPSLSADLEDWGIGEKLKQIRVQYSGIQVTSDFVRLSYSVIVGR